ncbi:MAG TPA: tetratricopeptide repeat protein [Acidobacteriota bacterium]|nr:tetratricopeptide repeat protein [Acidobacteriota bacterium]
MAILTVLVGLVYLNSFPGEFHLDDFELLLENPGLTQEPFRYGSFLDHYGGRPLTLWSFHLNYALAGDSPLSYHAVSLLLHVLATLGLFLLLTRPWPSPATSRKSDTEPREPAPKRSPLLPLPWAFAAAALFALHPLQSQPVNYIWSRSMLLTAVFSLAALLLAGRRRWVAMAAWQLALWSRMDAIVLLPFLLLAEGRLSRRWMIQAGANLALFAGSILYYSPADVAWNYSDPWAFWMAQPAALAHYLRLMLWPSELTIEHDLQPSLFMGLAGVAVLALTAVLLFRALKRLPGRGAWAEAQALPARGGSARFRKWAGPGLYLPALGLAWTLAWLAPSMLIPNAELLNESRAYVALAGMAALLCWLLSRMASRLKGEASWTAATVMTVLLLLAGAGVRERNQIWLDDVALYREAVQRSPQKMRVHYNLGSALAREGEPGRAEDSFRRALKLDPLDDLNHSAMGYCAEVQGRMAEAVQHYRRALELNPYNRRAADGLDRLSPVPKDAL